MFEVLLLLQTTSSYPVAWTLAVVPCPSGCWCPPLCVCGGIGELLDSSEGVFENKLPLNSDTRVMGELCAIVCYNFVLQKVLKISSKKTKEEGDKCIVTVSESEGKYGKQMQGKCRKIQRNR